VDLDLQAAGQGVHHRDADSVQATGDRVRLSVELAARVQRREHHLDRGALLHRVDVDRDTAAVVLVPHAPVGQQGYLDGVAVTGQRLIDGVVDDFIDEMVESALPG
jgi:hypothetical protein